MLREQTHFPERAAGPLLSHAVSVPDSCCAKKKKNSSPSTTVLLHLFIPQEQQAVSVSVIPEYWPARPSTILLYSYALEHTRDTVSKRHSGRLKPLSALTQHRQGSDTTAPACTLTPLPTDPLTFLDAVLIFNSFAIIRVNIHRQGKQNPHVFCPPWSQSFGPFFASIHPSLRFALGGLLLRPQAPFSWPLSSSHTPANARDSHARPQPSSLPFSTRHLSTIHTSVISCRSLIKLYSFAPLQ
ncbi:hypothetical protein QBC36DRAFT_129370 [Triangularia setosa]|uniref:Uncharacterized protein n=1 Tax=Triangularia setosa TaxID=2587417 RepID=A0AAN6WFV7_9PEZI|nr:hypothetical protein QBC36DRAFT_129370 [Podospora setosa]